MKIKIPKRIVKRLKWGIAGCGRFAENTFIPTLHLLPKSKLVSVYSSDAKRSMAIAEKFGVPNHFSDYSEFLRSDIDCVYIASANYNHYAQVLEAARAGKHILCEKPLALNSKEAKEMVDVCRENKVCLSINYVHRFHPLVIKAKEIVQKGMIGKIVSVSASYNADYPPDENFRFKKALSGGGALWDIGTHMIDLLRYLGGEVVQIKGYVDNVIYKSEVDDFASAIVKFENGGYGQFNVSFNVKKPFNRVEILGHSGSICIENLIGKKASPCKLIINLNSEAKKAFRKRANKQYYLIKSVQQSFLKNTAPLITGYDGLANIRLMEDLERQCH